MPEIPELEVLRAQLSKDVVGRKVKAVALTTGKTVPAHKDVKSFRGLLEGRTIKQVGRLGRALTFPLDGGDTLVMDLGRQGVLERPRSAKDAKTKHTVAVLTFATGADLRVVDPAGEVRLEVASAPAPEEPVTVNMFAARLSVGGDGLATRHQVPPLAQRGLDYLEDQFGWDRFARVLQFKKMPLKTVLLDQEVVSGLGDVVIDEALAQAGLVPDRPSEQISSIEARRLHRAIGDAIAEILKAGGATTTAYPFRDLEGRPGSFGGEALVTDRLGAPCRTCRTPLTTLGSGAATAVGCARCQS
jgi:formamidopyrimidine-DNA glycosylase